MNVFSDALIRVVGFTRHELHPIIGAVRQPSAKVPFGKPTPPANLKHLVEIKLINSKDDCKADNPGKTGQLLEKDRTISLLQSGVKRVVPLIEKNPPVHHRQSERDNDGEQSPGCPAVLRGPVRADHGPCRRKQPAQARCGWYLRMIGSSNANSRMTGAMSFRMLARWSLTVANSRIFPFVSTIQLLAHWSPPQTLCLLPFRL